MLPYLLNGLENEAKLNLVTIFTDSDYGFWESLQFPRAKHYSRVSVQFKIHLADGISCITHTLYS